MFFKRLNGNCQIPGRVATMHMLQLLKTSRSIIIIISIIAIGGCRTALISKTETAAKTSTNTSYTSTARAVEGIREWLVCGPYVPNSVTHDDKLVAGYDFDYLKAVAGETSVLPAEGDRVKYADAEFSWRRYRSPDNAINFGDAFKEYGDLTGTVAYAYTTLCRNNVGRIYLAVDSVNSVKMFLNGQCIHDRLVTRGVRKKESIVPVFLKEGKNRMLVKVLNGSAASKVGVREVTTAEAITEFEQTIALKYRPVFTGNALPEFDLDIPYWVRDLVGPCRIQVRYYDGDYNEVKEANKDGRYAAIVEITPKVGKSLKRYVTLFRQPQTFRWSRWKWDSFEGELPEELGIDRQVSRQQRDVLAKFVQYCIADKTYDNNRWHEISNAAIVFAWLYETSPSDPPAIQRTDAWAKNAHWWVGLRKKLGELDTRRIVKLPKDYEKDTKKRWPLLMYLHGSTPRGEDLERLKMYGIPTMIAEGYEFPFIVVCPQCPNGRAWWPAELASLLDEMAAKYRVDPDRVYLTGISLGGHGAWDFATEYPERFAAIAPVCGGGDPRDAERIKDIPTWVFHSAKDTIVPIARSEEMVKAMRDIGGKPKFTVFPDAGHNCWVETYKNEQLYEWFLSHRRSQRQPNLKDG